MSPWKSIFLLIAQSKNSLKSSFQVNPHVTLEVDILVNCPIKELPEEHIPLPFLVCQINTLKFFLPVFIFTEPILQNFDCLILHEVVFGDYMIALTVNIVEGLIEAVSHPQNPEKEPHLLKVQFFLHVLCFLIFKFRGRFKSIIDSFLTVKQITSLCHVIDSILNLIYCQPLLVIDIKQVKHFLHSFISCVGSISRMGSQLISVASIMSLVEVNQAIL